MHCLVWVLPKNIINTMNQLLKSEIEKETGITLANNWHKEFVAYINYLINNDFEKLVFLLYRIDVSEPIIKQLLIHDASTNAAELIAQAIINRQLEKIETRKKFTTNSDNCTEEKW